MLLTDWNMDDALRVREEEGILIGMQQGMREERKEIARNMLAKGMDVETIASITGLFIDDVLRLQGE